LFSVSRDKLGDNKCETPGARSTKMKLIARFVKNESGATAIEYGLIAALISVAIIGGATALGTGLNTLFTNIDGQL
jgi:pilus assembly protein Flp/PilA